MNREIKFRAWDKEGKRWMDDPDYAVCNCGSIFLRKSGTTDYSCTKTDRFVLMQYTGLKDKNGREIYDGDILDAFGGKAVVRWNGWCYEPLDICTCGCSREFQKNPSKISEKMKVLGNIYENPELIKE